MTQEIAYLRVVHQHPDLPPEFKIDRPIVTIGRHPSNDITLPFSSVSRFHSRIEVHNNRFYIIDLNSSNGTYVNGRRITQSALSDGDIVIFGNIELQFSRESLVEKIGREEDSQATEVEIITTQVGGQTEIRSKINVDSTPLPGAEAECLDRNTLIRAHGRLATLYKLSDILRSVSDEKEMLRRVLSLIFDVLPADRGAILLTTNDKAKPLRAAIVRHRDATSKPSEIAVSETIVNRCINERVAILSSDALTDTRFDAAESIVQHEIRSIMCVPLIVQNKVVGLIHVDTRESVQAFTEEDLAFLTSIANELAVSIEHLRLQQEFICKERMAAIGETITSIAHSIKNLLLLSRGGCELMDKSIRQNSIESVKDCWGVIKRTLDKISSMVRDMLEYSRQRRIEYRECDINELIRSICASFENELKKKNIELELDLDQQIQSRKLDEDGLHRVLVNLLVNAIESINRPQGKILVQTSLLPTNSIMIKVSDNGIGIPEEDISKIFYPFYSTKGAVGTGLGLPITQKIIEELGGKIEVESVRNEGTTFTVTVPLLETSCFDVNDS
ncbi:FHA domain-containing protein [Candidatus Sumerlaeota bacterium]|nr:FHA domain-containing protein [Candidatus Sumerlaeota bacterium]